jgi:hypothetical protein
MLIDVLRLSIRLLIGGAAMTISIGLLFLLIIIVFKVIEKIALKFKLDKWE